MRKSFVQAGRVLAVLGVASAWLSAGSPAFAQTPTWMDTSESPAMRANQLLSAMTLDEKLAMTHGGASAAGGGAGAVAGNTRLGIPSLVMSDGPLGVGNAASGVTQWPDALNSAATWNPELVGQLGQAMGAEFFGKGRNVALTPTVNILRVPLWGRAFETFSEDPYLTSLMGVAEIKGVQSQNVMATVKHFAANNQEVLRDGINVEVSEQAQHELYFPAFEAAVKDAKVGSVMCSYNRVNGEYACENGELLTTTLRNLWNFTGFVVSDWGATHSTAKAANAGLEVEMPGAADGSSAFGAALKAAVASGAVSNARLDGMIRDVLAAMFDVGLFDHPVTAPAATVSTAEHKQLATRLSQDGTVLLKNQGELPLADSANRKIAVIGYSADAGAQYAGGGSANVIASGTPVSPLAGITARATASGVTYTRGPGGPLPALPSSRVTATDGTAGFTGTYYSTADFSGTPIAVRTDPTVDFGVGTLGEYALPVAGSRSVRWEGNLKVNTTGSYRFSTHVNGSVKLYVNGALVIDSGSSALTTALGEGAVTLTAGQAAAIRVDYNPVSFPQFNVLFAHLTLGARTPDDPDPIVVAAQAAKNADVAVVFASDLTTEGRDRTSLALPGDSDALIDAVATANPHTVVVLNTSSAVTMPWLDKVGAVLEAWYPGQQYGTAIASLLFGDVNPSGKLPLTFPATDQQGPWAAGTLQYPGDGTNVFYSEGLQVGYRWYDAQQAKPLFAFGHGLSYTTFTFSNLALTARPDGAVDASFDVTNTGTRQGAEVAQVYLGAGPPRAGVQQAVRSLRGFQRISLDPGQSKRQTVTLDRRSFQYWDTTTHAWTTNYGQRTIWVGDSSANLPLSATTAPLSSTSSTGSVGGSVPATLSLTLGTPASFGPFQPGAAKDYTASTTATVTSTAGDASLAVDDPSPAATGHLVNGAFSLPSPLMANGSTLPATIKTWNGPVSNDQVNVPFTQHINATDALRTGTYSKTLTFTLSTTAP